MGADSERVLVVSDLHLGDKGSLEDFHHDEAFTAFLAAYGKLGNTRLILNGDFIDYLQIQPLGALTVPTAVNKTESAFEQHGPVLRALATFSRTGNRVTVVEGNHDIELLFPKVREAFRSAFHAAGGDLGKLEFADSVVADYPYFHIEHGHQADRLNRFDYSALLANEKTETLSFPWGSRFVHRVFNNVEPEYPFIDKIRPESAAALILYLVDRKLFRTVFIPFMGLETEDWLGRLRLASLAQPQAGAKGPSGEDPLGGFASEWTDMFDSLETLEYYGPAAASDAAAKGKVIDSVVSEFIVRLNESAQKRRNSKTAYDAVAAKKCIERTGAQLVVYGHTHHAGRLVLGDGKSYINSGTWTPLLDLPTKMGTREWLQKLASPGNYPVTNMPSFVDIVRDGTHQRAELMYWDPRSNTTVPGGY
jgi:UDP-2,3-diacylglucosamine pyrophosphatase LpxH